MISKTFSTIQNLGYKNLVVGGCSFTYNNSKEHVVTWPYYLRDFCEVDQVLDCSMPGAGNYHIANSLIWNLENQNLNLAETLVIVMWSGVNRDDCIMSADYKNNYDFQFNYNDTVSTGISGGDTAGSSGNTNNDAFRSIQAIKSPQSRAIENFLYVTGLYNYLENKNLKFLFLTYLDYKLPNRSGDFDPMDYLPENLKNKYKQMFAPGIENIYRFCLKNNLLTSDDFHPSPDGHMQWTKKHLVPYLLDNFCNSDS